MDATAQRDMEKDEASSSSKKHRGQKWPRTNSVRFYREKRDFTLQEVAKALGTKHQTIQKLETGTMKLTPEWATKIGSILKVPAKFLAFSNEPNVYSWAVKPVPVVGVVDGEMRVNLSETPSRRIGIPDAPPGLRALELGKESMPGFEGWFILFDEDVCERVTQEALDRQEHNKKFLIHTQDGQTWWRNIVSSATRNIYHLEALHKPTIYDVAIDWVSEIRGFEPPGNDLPPFDQQP